MRGAWRAVALVALVGCTYRAPTQMPGRHDAFPRDPDTFARVQVGMRPAEVQALLGPPDVLDYYITWRGWLVFPLPLPDEWRPIWHYRGLGRVIFSCWVFDGDGTVRQVEVDPTEVVN